MKRFGKLAAAIVCVAALTAAGGRANAWAAEGHAIIADVAAQGLSKSARSHVASLLGGKSMADVASWADDLRVWQNHPTDPPPASLAGDPEAAAFIVPANSAQPSWHYANLPLGTPAYDPNGVGAGRNDVVHALERCIAILQTGTDPEPGGKIDQAQALRLVIHYVGDIHQPLHAACAYWIATPDGHVARASLADTAIAVNDHGGNLLRYGPERTDNLHAYWDAHMVTAVKGAQSEDAFEASLVADIRRERKRVWGEAGDAVKRPETWIVESAAAASKVYEGVDVNGLRLTDGALSGQIALAADYDDTHSALARQQLEAAGYRLAALLNAIWK
jgi:hypothetical protein